MVRLAAGVTLVVVGVVAGGAVAVAVGGDSGDAADGHADSGDSGEAGANDHATADDHPTDESDRRRDNGHRHERLAPYDQRYEGASAEQQAAADALSADVRATLVAYEDVDAAIAAGYQPPRRPHGPREHYLNPTIVGEAADGDGGAVLDPSRPSGLVYYTGGSGDPMLIGAFFVAPPGTEAPMPAGDLVVWHSHSPSCPGFFATADAPCAEARRMLHAWTAEQFEIVARRPGQPTEVQVVDPFGAPFGAAISPS